MHFHFQVFQAFSAHTIRIFILQPRFQLLIHFESVALALSDVAGFAFDGFVAAGAGFLFVVTHTLKFYGHRGHGGTTEFAELLRDLCVPNFRN